MGWCLGQEGIHEAHGTMGTQTLVAFPDSEHGAHLRL